ncbi:phage portal protein [Virgibacillus halodenitrificans]|uniref:phage portal protein n=1 Tax=Virgibacillus halodenitrificans TaxID=1482 RepID=UPI001FB4EF33|nr:phage portal protein [Virgibacillus halodenitrificans]MCJ0932934.1 phage portal protein [Virgibacillus halodenitrificans]
MQKYVSFIRENNNKITGKILQEIITDHEEERNLMIKLYARYMASRKGVPIFNRKHPDYDEFSLRSVKRIDDKVNNTLNNAFDGEIIDTATGYFLGHPISYKYNDGEEANGTSPITTEIDTFNLRNHVEDADAELGKMAIICGKAARLAYIEKGTGHERIKNIDPWQVIFIGDNIHEPDYSIRYFKDSEGKNRAEFYNDRYIYHFTEESGKYEEGEKEEHFFEFNPLFGLANNKEKQGDAEKVLYLIDAYDRTLSDASNEIEQYRLAYMVFKGLRADDETADDLPRTRIIELLEKDDSVDYLTKDINDDLIEHHLDRLEKNILKFAKSVDFSDDQFGTTVTGVAMRYKLLSLENKCITKERKMTAALRYQYKVIFSAWAKRKNVAKDDYLKVGFTFKRNLPVDVEGEAKTTSMLQGRVPEEKRLSLLSFIEDPKAALEEMQKEQDDFDNRQEPLGGEDVDEPTSD